MLPCGGGALVLLCVAAALCDGVGVLGSGNLQLERAAGLLDANESDASVQSFAVTVALNEDISSFNAPMFIKIVNAILEVPGNVQLVAQHIWEGSVLLDIFFRSANSSSVVDKYADSLLAQGTDQHSPLRQNMTSIIDAYPTSSPPRVRQIDDDSATPAEIAAVVVCSVVLYIMICCCIFCLFARQKQRRRINAEKSEPNRGAAHKANQVSPGKLHVIANAIAMHHGTLDAGIDSIAHPTGDSSAERNSAMIKVDALRQLLQTCRVPHLSEAFISSLRRSREEQERGEVRKSYVLNTLRAALAADPTSARQPADPSSVDRSFDHHICPHLFRLFNRAGGTSGDATTNQVLLAIRQDPKVMWSHHTPPRNWGGPVVEALEKKPPTESIVWEDFEMLCRSAHAEMYARENAGVQTHENNPLLLMPTMITHEFEEGHEVNAEFHGEWFDAVVAEIVQPRDDLPEGGYVVIWAEDDSRTLVKRSEVRARGVFSDAAGAGGQEASLDRIHVDVDARGADDAPQEHLSPAPPREAGSATEEAVHTEDAPVVTESDAPLESPSVAPTPLPEEAPSEAAPAESVAGMTFEIGQSVRVLWGDTPEWFDATVCGYDPTTNTYNVDWGDTTGTDGISPESMQLASPE